MITHIKDQGRSVLEIRGETNTSDAGTYTAVAVNKAGKAESVGEIQIYSESIRIPECCRFLMNLAPGLTEGRGYLGAESYLSSALCDRFSQPQASFLPHQYD